MTKEDVNEILNKYRSKIEEHIDDESEGDVDSEKNKEFSTQYQTFRKEALSEKTTRYESWCNKAENIIKLKPSDKLLPQLEEAISTAHLNITPTGAVSFAALSSMLIILFSVVFGAVLYLTTNKIPIFTVLTLFILSLVTLIYLNKMPIYIATKWRLKASNQMVLAILYVVIYMRHTSNLEHAIKFAAQHIEAPLALDLKKIFWDVETGRYSTIKESLDNYLETWRKYNLEFVTSFHLIVSSLYEPTDSRRNDLLDKALSVILDGTYEKMLHYAQDIKSPITTLHMLGIILPILGLVIFPLVGAFLQGLVKWYHLAFLYNLALPLLVYILGMNVLSKRPTGYGESKVAKATYEDKFDPKVFCFTIGIFLFAIGIFPLILNLISPPVFAPGQVCALNDINMKLFGCFFGYVEFEGKNYGPFGIGALILSFFVPAAFAFSLGIYNKLKSKKTIELREETKRLESEFSSALFQLGNRIGDGIPTELAFNKVAQTMEGTPAGTFFKVVDNNIRQLGMGIEEAIFNEKNGAILAYPSPLIESSMEVLLESSKKGPKIVSQSLISISTYVERIHKVAERLKDLLAEIISSMKSQISFLTPTIAGIVVGISSMIVNIIVSLNLRINDFTLEAGGSPADSAGALTNIGDLFKLSGIIPNYWFQVVVGLYVVQLAYILTVLQNGIENGNDKINERYLLGKNITRSFLIYVVIALVVTVLFNLMVKNLLSGALG
ncbi:MAG TPA: hypothetical protein VJI68_00045 [Candidatus Nanoarchaeia archaeon]|nr:hypothetical protein [Candidatus Nanoarchaeia archaeon]